MRRADLESSLFPFTLAGEEIKTQRSEGMERGSTDAPSEVKLMSFYSWEMSVGDHWILVINKLNIYVELIRKEESGLVTIWLKGQEWDRNDSRVGRRKPCRCVLEDLGMPPAVISAVLNKFC